MARPRIDKHYWGLPDSYKPGWSKRAKLAAQFLPQQGRIVDIGCGAPMALGRFLAPGVTYCPADVRSWAPEVTEVDLDAGQFPGGRYDAIVMLCVLEYLKNPGLALRWAKRASNRLIVSYAVPVGHNYDDARARLGFINCIREAAFEGFLERKGWRIADKAVYDENETTRELVYACDGAESVAVRAAS